MKRTAARILLGLPGLFIFATGVVFLTRPEAAAAKLLLDAQGAEGLSNLRGMAGAPLLAVGTSILLAAKTTKLEYARPGALFLLALIGARVLSFVVDGAAQPIGLFLTVPTIAFLLMLAGHKLLDAANAEAGSVPTGGAARTAVT